MLVYISRVVEKSLSPWMQIMERMHLAGPSGRELLAWGLQAGGLRGGSSAQVWLGPPWRVLAVVQGLSRALWFCFACLVGKPDSRRDTGCASFQLGQQHPWDAGGSTGLGGSIATLVAFSLVPGGHPRCRKHPHSPGTLAGLSLLLFGRFSNPRPFLPTVVILRA